MWKQVPDKCLRERQKWPEVIPTQARIYDDSGHGKRKEKKASRQTILHRVLKVKAAP